MKKGEFHYRKFLKDDARRKKIRVDIMTDAIEPVLGERCAKKIAEMMEK